jgi:hypothetical protein
MIFVYLSDESIHTLQNVVVPDEGKHLGEEWIPVLLEVCEWRKIMQPNQIALKTHITDVRELERVKGHLRENMPTQDFMIAVLSGLQDELQYISKIEVPSLEEQLETAGAGYYEDEPESFETGVIVEDLYDTDLDGATEEE